MHCMHNETMHARTGVRVYVPSSSGPAPVGAPYQVALAASQLGSVVKSEALKLTGLAHEPHVARSKKRSATTVEGKVAIIVLVERAAIRAISRQTGEVLCVSLVEEEQPCSGIYRQEMHRRNA